MTRPEDRRAALRDYREIARELEEVAELILRHPELNHHAAERLQVIARDIRTDLARATKSP